VPIAVITFDFDPVLDLGDVTIRWQTVALAATIFVALCIAAAFARRTRLRADDLLTEEEYTAAKARSLQRG